MTLGFGGLPGPLAFTFLDLYLGALSFLLAGSIFGLDEYLRIIKKHYHPKIRK